MTVDQITGITTKVAASKGIPREKSYFNRGWGRFTNSINQWVNVTAHSLAGSSTASSTIIQSREVTVLPAAIQAVNPKRARSMNIPRVKK